MIFFHKAGVEINGGQVSEEYLFVKKEHLILLEDLAYFVNAPPEYIKKSK